MTPVAPETIARAVDILGAHDLSEDEVESRVAALVADSMTASRLIDWIPEAFGSVWISHLGKVTLPTTFSAQHTSGEWEEFPLTSEPIFDAALPIAQAMFHDGQRAVFENLLSRSCLAGAINRMLNKRRPLDGSVVEGVVLLRIPAEVYHATRKSFWRRLFS